MQDLLGERLKQLKMRRVRKTRMAAILLALSLMVSLNVFWALRQPGLTLAGDADCAITEHTHKESCQQPCLIPEHIHTVECYADLSADTETMLDWQRMFAQYPFTGSLRQDLVGIAKTQVGYTESQENFQTAQDGVRRGYTRYGQWYGAPYNDWSAMFVSFCLHYAGADPEQNPGNSGAASMATLWQQLDRYAPVGEYEPMAGDLVFFTDNTVGIVTEVYSAACNVILGDQDGAVASKTVLITDAAIAGWGITEDPPEEPAPEIDLLDISNGPAVFLFQGQQGLQTRPYAMRNNQAITDILPYLLNNGGSYFFTLLDINNQELPKDDQGNYIAIANTGYKLTVTFTSPEGFLPGTYQYQVPNGLMVDGGSGTFILSDGTNVGDWTVTDTGLITLVFNEHMNSRTEITISATMGLHFPEQEEPIDFDGQIIVKVEKPPQDTYPTVINKWGNQGGVAGSAGTDPSKIYWGIEIIGNRDSQIPGNILTDRALTGQWSKTHTFTESDIAAGLTFGVSENGNWHSWKVTADDPHLVWTETGWTYKIPKSAVCQVCGELELGNEGWVYYIEYSSTPTDDGTAGTFGYENDATIDGAYGYAWVNFAHAETHGIIEKNGAFVSDAADGGFLWEVRAEIPGRKEGQRADYHWYIMDSMKLLDHNGQAVGLVENTAHLAAVTVTYNGVTIPVPRIQDATEHDRFAWDNAWTATENGVNYGREFNLLSRCTCTAETCHWGGGCADYWFIRDDGTADTAGFCQCWTETADVTFTFLYETDDLTLLEDYGGLGYQVQNLAELFYIPDGQQVGASVDRDDANVTIPGIFQKELTHDFDGYTAHYKVTINESKLVLTDGGPLDVHDVMTKTLSYISGSLVITTEDADGNRATLRQDVDYTVTYDGTGNQTDVMGNEVHVLDIVILHPQPVMYVLDYDATLIIPEQVTEGVRYANSASITLWGESITDNSVEKIYADINIAAKNYRVEMFKTSALTGEPLAGATFGLYNAQGGLITYDVTDEKGELMFQTNIIEGIILREHVLYYMQEQNAPPGYKLDDTKYWFCFCDHLGDFCAVCDQVMEGKEAVRIPFEQIGKVNATNQLMDYDLPATGGPGIYPLILASVICIVTPLVYETVRRRKRERRGAD